IYTYGRAWKKIVATCIFCIDMAGKGGHSADTSRSARDRDPHERPALRGAAGMEEGMLPNRTLAEYIRQHGPVRAVRVSSAQARGHAKQYSYWGPARYELRLSRDGYVIAVAVERA